MSTCKKTSRKAEELALWLQKPLCFVTFKKSSYKRKLTVISWKHTGWCKRCMYLNTEKYLCAYTVNSEEMLSTYSLNLKRYPQSINTGTFKTCWFEVTSNISAIMLLCFSCFKTRFITWLLFNCSLVLMCFKLGLLRIIIQLNRATVYPPVIFDLHCNQPNVYIML